MKVTWAWSMAVIVGLAAGNPLETRAGGLAAQDDTFPRMTAVGAQRGSQPKEEKTAFGCWGGIGCTPSYGYGCGVGIGGCGIGIGCGGYGYSGCNYGVCGYGCRPRCRTYSSPCSPCGGYGYGGCGTICGPTYYGGYSGGCAPIAAPIYSDPTWGVGVSPCGYGAPGYGVPGYGVGGYGVAPAPYYGGVNYFSEADTDSDILPVRNTSRRNSRRLQGPGMDRSRQYQGPAQGPGMDDSDSPYFQ